MIGIIQKYKFNKAIKSYIYDLGPNLVKRYGQSEQYTVMQIKKTAKNLGLNMQFIPYAIAIYRHEESVNTINCYRIDQSFLNKLRYELSLILFGYIKEYRIEDIISQATPMGWKGGVCKNTNLCGLAFVGGGGIW